MEIVRFKIEILGKNYKIFLNQGGDLSYPVVSKEHYPPSSKARFFNLDLQSGGYLLTAAFSFLDIPKKPSVKIPIRTGQKRMFCVDYFCNFEDYFRKGKRQESRDRRRRVRLRPPKAGFDATRPSSLRYDATGKMDEMGEKQHGLKSILHTQGRNDKKRSHPLSAGVARKALEENDRDFYDIPSIILRI